MFAEAQGGCPHGACECQGSAHVHASPADGLPLGWFCQEMIFMNVTGKVAV